MLFDLLFFPVTLPTAGIKFVFRQILTVAEKELYDPEKIHEELLLLQLRLEEGRISEQEYEKQEAAIMLRLREVRERQQSGR